MIVRSPLLAAIANVRHGFSTRVGGVSGGPFASLNLAANVGDDPDAVAENRRRFLAAIAHAGEAPHPPTDFLGAISGAAAPPSSTPPGALGLAQANQVHGARIIDVDAPAELAVDADALATARPDVAVAVRTADCAPILLAVLDRPRHAARVAAVHAGWRGATAGIAARAIDHLGADPGQLVAAIGPTIGVDDFEVGDEVIEAARVSLGGAAPPAIRGPSGRMHLDLTALIVEHLLRRGVPRAQIEVVGGSTIDAARYYSHRRDRGFTGRHLSAIALVPEPSAE